MPWCPERCLRGFLEVPHRFLRGPSEVPWRFLQRRLRGGSSSALEVPERSLRDVSCLEGALEVPTTCLRGALEVP